METNEAAMTSIPMTEHFVLSLTGTELLTLVSLLFTAIGAIFLLFNWAWRVRQQIDVKIEAYRVECEGRDKFTTERVHALETNLRETFVSKDAIDDLKDSIKADFETLRQQISTLFVAALGKKTDE